MAKRTFSGSVVQHKTGTASQWASVNPTLAKGEIGVEIDAGRIKIGDGVTVWNALPYIGQSSTAPVGHIQQQYTVESGYLALDGKTYSRTTYAALWAWANSVSGLVAASPSNYQFGTGDGNTTFIVPNHTGRVWQGTASIGQAEAGLPNITGQFGDGNAGFWGSSGNSGALYAGDDTEMDSAHDLSTGHTGTHWLTFNASKSNPIYGNGDTVQSPAILLIPQIKY